MQCPKNRKLCKLAIRDKKHLCYLLKINYNNLTQICDGISRNPRKYYSFKLMIKKGKVRNLATPKGELRRILRNLNILLQRFDFPNNMHGGIKGRTTLTYALPHLSKPAVLKSDITDFFPSIHPKRVYIMFINTLKCTPDVAHYLTRLTTIKGELPQGSPTSAVIANIINLGIASRIKGLAKTFNGDSGTFVDDIVLSGPKFIGRFKPIVLKIIKQEGFNANRKKSECFSGNSETVIAGIRVENGIDVPSKKIKEVRDIIDEFKNRCNYGECLKDSEIKSVYGKIGYIKRLNKGAAKSLQRQLDKICNRDRKNKNN